MPDQSNKPSLFKWLIPVVIVGVLILLIGAIPGVHASVINRLGISIAPSSQVPAAPLTLQALATSTPAEAGAVVNASPVPAQLTSPAALTIPPSTAQSAGASGTSTDIKELSSQVGWEVLSPTVLPAGYKYQSAYFDVTNKMLVLTYLVTRPLPGATDPSLTSSETISLIESPNNDFVPMQIAPNTVFTDTLVNGQPAVYNLGGWDSQFIKDNTQPNGGKMVSSWRNDLPVKNLYWQVGDIYLLLVSSDAAVSQPELLDIASSVGR